MDRPLIMGIVNVTPDSFSDGGRYFDAQAAIAHGHRLIDEGADILDIGGESTRPGAAEVPAEEELRRVLPVLQGLRPIATAAQVRLSVDTRHAATMAACIDAGVDMINDISGLTHDSAAARICAAAEHVDVVLMHMQGSPQDMQAAPHYDDVVDEVFAWAEARIAAATAAGIAHERLWFDPGIGFGKTLAHNLDLLSALPGFLELGVPLLLGVSRKGFIAKLDRDVPPAQRVAGSLVVALEAASAGVAALRVHDVAETRQALAVQCALDAAWRAKLQLPLD